MPLVLQLHLIMTILHYLVLNRKISMSLFLNFVLTYCNDNRNQMSMCWVKLGHYHTNKYHHELDNLYFILPLTNHDFNIFHI